MIDTIHQLQEEIKALELRTSEELEAFRLKYLSKKGLINQLMADFKNVPNEEKRSIGKSINELKNAAQEKFDLLQLTLGKKSVANIKDDWTKPSTAFRLGSRHPISQVRKEIIGIFSRIGFQVSEGPEIDDDWHVFTGLNFPEEHPARDMQDTFFIQQNPDILLRTHTSSVQVREMQANKPPIRKLFPGRVFRNEAISSRAHCIFHQVEGLYIDENVSFADLRQTLLYFAQEYFGASTQIRLRPSYFPFTEPSAEMDISCSICGGKGCKVCKYTGYVEIMGCGMVDPNVLKLSNIDSEKSTGYAFGMGIERIAMLKYQINDIRLFYENDVRFLSEFEKC